MIEEHAMTNPNTAPVEQVDREGPAPLPRPETLHCAGCKHLVTKWWKDYLDNDETDSGTSARCAAVPTEHGGKSITAYWSNTTNAPDWCPFLDSATPDLATTAPLQARVETLEAALEAKTVEMNEVCISYVAALDALAGLISVFPLAQLNTREQLAQQLTDATEIDKILAAHAALSTTPATSRLAELEAENARLRPLEDAPKDATWIVGWFKAGFTVRPTTIHWAQDLSGEEQPPYQGWFRDWGGAGFAEVDMANFIGWEPIHESAARAALNPEGES